MKNLAPKLALQKAIEQAGGQSKLADLINQRIKRKVPLKQGHIGTWMSKNKKGTPPEFCPIIEDLLGIRKEDLRPDVFIPAVRQ